MSKLCTCKESIIYGFVSNHADGYSYHDEDELAENLINELNLDCVCERDDKRIYDEIVKGRLVFGIVCDHKPHTKNKLTGLWSCKCGLKNTIGGPKNDELEPCSKHHAWIASKCSQCKEEDLLPTPVKIHSSESKEVRNLDCPNKCTVEEAVDRGCIYCAHKAVYKSKQSQSPCDHEWWKMKDMVFERVLPEKSAYWNHEDACLYNCFKCGLVTCKNPNE